MSRAGWLAAVSLLVACGETSGGGSTRADSGGPPISPPDAGLPGPQQGPPADGGDPSDAGSLLDGGQPEDGGSVRDGGAVACTPGPLGRGSADACSTLMPVLGNPVRHRYLEDPETTCDTRSIPSSGDGVVAHQALRADDDPDVYLIGPDGGEVGRFSGGPSYGVFVSPLQDGFIFSVDFPGGSNINALIFTDSRGQRRGQADATGGVAFPGGGALLFSLADYLPSYGDPLGCDEGAEIELLARSDDSGKIQWPDWVSTTCLHRPNVDTAMGATTIDGYFFTAKARTRSGPWLARWFSPDGKEIARGNLGGLPEDGVTFWSAPLADGSVAIEIGRASCRERV